MLNFLAWLILLVLCWPLALLTLAVWPLLWVVSIAFRLIGIGVGAVLALVRAIVYLPSRLLGFGR
jgi:hypothetical protein